eukprot:CAMPEP_0194503690 /NCGR_PEP_ID=MMETSP0253-20130528/28518_1 /TAXON_ID=2966 /ORGANISM="Noctiluca scintillans" /LENGTH=422 /DNA_ID=CAMNT_0039345995 /DNA_START=172 /DNA_END=1442 /DNA_ORIENTATION=+
MTDFGAGLCFAYQCLLGVTLLAHFRASTTDPGTVRQAKAPPRFRNPRMCKICSDGWKPPRAHHCKVCQSCIFRMDHHCPWINNCVGLQNQKVFILFLSYTLLTALVTLVLILGSAACWLFGLGAPARPSDSFWGVCMTTLVALMCIASLFFVTEFLQEQLEGIQSNSTLVETYQRTHGAQSTFRNHLLGVFGTKWWIWLWPCPSAPPPDYSEPALPNDESGPRSINADSAHAMGIAGEETEYCLGFFAGGVGSSGRLHRGRRSYGRATPGSAGRPSVDSTDRPVDNQFDRTRQSSAGFSGLSGFPLRESGREETGHKADAELAEVGNHSGWQRAQGGVRKALSTPSNALSALQLTGRARPWMGQAELRRMVHIRRACLSMQQAVFCWGVLALIGKTCRLSMVLVDWDDDRWEEAQKRGGRAS